MVRCHWPAARVMCRGHSVASTQQQGVFKAPRADEQQSGVSASCGAALQDALVRLYRSSSSEAAKPWRQKLHAALVALGAEAAAASALRHLERQAVRWGHIGWGLGRMQEGFVLCLQGRIITITIMCRGAARAGTGPAGGRAFSTGVTLLEGVMGAHNGTPSVCVTHRQIQTQTHTRAGCTICFSPRQSCSRGLCKVTPAWQRHTCHSTVRYRSSVHRPWRRQETAPRFCKHTGARQAHTRRRTHKGTAPHTLTKARHLSGECCSPHS